MSESSVLAPEQVEEVVRDVYALPGIYGVTPLKGGTAACRRIHTIDGDYVLKEFPAKYRLDDIAAEPEVCRFLVQRGFPAPRFVPTRRGDTVWEREGRVFHLQEFLSGKIPAQNTAPNWLLKESAILLGRLHRTLAEYPRMKPGFHQAWFKWDATAKEKEYDELIDFARNRPQSRKHDRIIEDLEYKKGSLHRAARTVIDPDRLTERNSHGDYHVSQLICGQENVRAVIDFSSACSLPAVWEVLRSYTLADPRCERGAIDTHRLKIYIQIYLRSGGELAWEDLTLIPRLYYLQLMRSTYGYREYLKEDGSTRGGAKRAASLLRFGLWRTNVCRWLERHGPSLSQDLARMLS